MILSGQQFKHLTSSMQVEFDVSENPIDKDRLVDMINRQEDIPLQVIVRPVLVVGNSSMGIKDTVTVELAIHP